jgi:hypothetical protein
MSTKTRDDYIAIVSSPGKFEGEPAYVPYYWDVYLDGGAGRDNVDLLGFDVTAEDKALFPELKHRLAVTLRETDQGFVVEVPQ